MIAVVKGTGGTNIGSLCHALDRIGATYHVTDKHEAIRSAEKVILPGVGAAAKAMSALHDNGLAPLIKSLTQPVLGICLGMQLFFERSEEGDVDCLGLIPGAVKSLIPRRDGMRVPHTGWNALIDFDSDYILCRGIGSTPYVYFVHSYAVESGPWIKASADYGGEIPAIIQHRNFYGCQFHPEKSATIGETILHNFSTMADKS